MYSNQEAEFWHVETVLPCFDVYCWSSKVMMQQDEQSNQTELVQPINTLSIYPVVDIQGV